ncbi:hypothetical protein JOY44_25500 (plasmid) [Phormidium sp. CLA17]|uniref:hypothetical protein n=1 Tax=Leptolyngbya sp. Cla-17 TaxID=2803751 RepID=UPI001490BDF3|nr:hypothetical protein [Leptolyngbya sp. Cla-17]MBM0744878.1 hypothetical protein [Leptolyngbya sp. Cla-17]
MESANNHLKLEDHNQSHGDIINPDPNAGDASANKSIGSSVQESDFNAALDQAADAFGDAKGKAKDLKGKVGDTLGEFKDTAFDAFDKAKSQAGALLNEAKNKDGENPNDNKSKGSESGEKVADLDKSAKSQSGSSSSGSKSAEDGLHVSPDALADTKSLDPTQVRNEENLAARLGANGDFLDGGGGSNTVIGAGGSDIIRGDTEGSFNTVTTGTGKDLITLGQEATNRVFDFDPANDQFGLTDSLTLDSILFGQGTNPQTGGLDQPLDSKNNTVVVDKTSEHILASLTFTNVGDISDQNFVQVSSQDLDRLAAGATGQAAKAA